MHYRIYTGMVIKRAVLREADEIITFWSWEEGKLRLLARGVKQAASKLRLLVSTLSWVELQVVPSGFLSVVAGGRVLKSYPHITRSLDRSASLFNLFELVMRATGDSEPNPQLTLLLQDAVSYLNSQSPLTLDFTNYFLSRLLNSLGYGLQFEHCSSCHKPLALVERTQFAPSLFGFVCKKCARFIVATSTTNSEFISYVQRMSVAKEAFSTYDIPDHLGLLARSILLACVHHVLARIPKSEQFLTQNT